jgi:phosphoglycolate phosphatase-like HAD superfamily hydrolase
MRELLEANSVDVEQYVSISQFEEVLLEAMRRNAKELPKRGYALAGVVEALQALSLSSNVVQSVLTGNIAANAFAKLNAFGLDEWVDLDVGGYGSDDIVRSNLVAIARRKVFEKYGMDFDESSTVLLGDTPLDIKAGHDGRAKVLAVATGSFSVDVLREAGADTVLNDLRDLDVFLKSLIDLRERAVTPR